MAALLEPKLVEAPIPPAALLGPQLESVSRPPKLLTITFPPERVAVTALPQLVVEVLSAKSVPLPAELRPAPAVPKLLPPPFDLVKPAIVEALPHVDVVPLPAVVEPPLEHLEQLPLLGVSKPPHAASKLLPSNSEQLLLTTANRQPPADLKPSPDGWKLEPQPEVSHHRQWTENHCPRLSYRYHHLEAHNHRAQEASSLQA